MHFFFCDDSRQNGPAHQGMGPFISTGEIAFPDDSIKYAEDVINAISKEFGFPKCGEFNWSSGQDLWMRDNLMNERRTEFFSRIIEAIKELEVTATIIIEDKKCKYATDTKSNEIDVTNFLIELKKLFYHGVRKTTLKSGANQAIHLISLSWL
jgi:hypothetical protein